MAGIHGQLTHPAAGLSSSTLIAVVGETNRAPFDLPEAECELVGGFHTEYSSLKFALFFLAEYVNMVTVSALAATLFLGGWRAPLPISIWHGANSGWWPLLWFFLKVIVALFVFVWLRGTLPRLRYDQFMRFGWKVLVPLALLWILVVATIRALPARRLDHRRSRSTWRCRASLVVAAGRRAAFGARAGAAEERRADEPAGADAGRRRRRVPADARRRSRPPMDLKVPPSPRLRAPVDRRCAPYRCADHRTAS